MEERIAYGPHTEQFGELSRPEGHEREPLVVLIHGGFWRDQYRLDLMHSLVADLNRNGYATWNIEYRRVGPTGGGYPTTFDDVASAIDLGAAMDWDSHAVIGHSAGGHLALWNASRTESVEPVALTVGLAPVADVIEANHNDVGVDATLNFFGGNVDEVPDHYDAGQPRPERFIGRVVLIHGDADTNVPVEQSRRLATAVHRCEILAGVDHFQVIDPAHHSWQIVLDELAKL